MATKLQISKSISSQYGVKCRVYGVEGQPDRWEVNGEHVIGSAGAKIEGLRLKKESRKSPEK